MSLLVMPCVEARAEDIPTISPTNIATRATPPIPAPLLRTTSVVPLRALLQQWRRSPFGPKHLIMALAMPHVEDGSVRPRLRSLDIVRGLIMVLMAIDHVRVFSGVPAGGPTFGRLLYPLGHALLRAWIRVLCRHRRVSARSTARQYQPRCRVPRGARTLAGVARAHGPALGMDLQLRSSSTTTWPESCG